MKQVFYAPERGDAVWISIVPQAARKQAARRPMVVLSPQAYNAKVGLALLCPITSQVKGYPFEVPVPPGLPISGTILADQAETLDWRNHRAELICSLPSPVIEETLGKLRTLLES
jgi:mRNA interferase MazF